jgi:hypothetical protein
VELQFLAVLDQRVELFLQGLLVFLDVSILIEAGFNLRVPVFPVFDFSKSAFQNSVDTIVFDFQIGNLCVV